MGKKRRKLYVVSSLHAARIQIMNHLIDLESILNARFGLIEAIARTAVKGSYFSDGMGKKYADGLNKQLSLLTPELAHQMVEKCKDEHSLLYELSKAVEVFKILESKGVKFQFKQTEVGEAEKRAAHYRDALATRILNGKERNFQRTEKYAAERILYLRDNDIIRSVMKSDTEHNILFMGSDHKLESLVKTHLEWYRIDIAQEGEAMTLTGNIPEMFKPEIDKFLREYGKKGTVGAKIKYIKP